jgi:hypothetical protein
VVVSTESVRDELAERIEREYEAVVVYGDADAKSVLHEGPIRLLANGWVKLPSGRLLSPEAVHHVDPRSGE